MVAKKSPALGDSAAWASHVHPQYHHMGRYSDGWWQFVSCCCGGWRSGCSERGSGYPLPCGRYAPEQRCGLVSIYDFINLFLEDCICKGKGRGRGRETSMWETLVWLPLTHHPTQEWTCQPRHVPWLESNQWSLVLRDDAQSAGPHW